ncbi:MAG: CatB-related O-acetyltransferase [Pseudomonadota bacterium]
MNSFIQYCIARMRISIGAFLRDRKELSARYPQYKIGRGSYGPLRIETYGDKSKLEIGAFCAIANGATVLLGGEHRSEWISTFPFDRKYLADRQLPHSSFARGDIVIGNDVWIGHDVLILSGTEIGDGAIIAARSVLRGKVEPYSIYAGTPAKFVRFRFTEEEIQSLMKIRWWDWDDARIAEQSHLLASGDLKSFIQKNIMGTNETQKPL